MRLAIPLAIPLVVALGHLAAADEVPGLRQRYYVLRHGQSLANVEGIISSDPRVARVEHGLSAVGREQAAAAAAAVVQEAERTGAEGVAIVSSDFRRAWQTASSVRAAVLAAGVRVWPSADGPLEARALRERCGSAAAREAARRACCPAAAELSPLAASFCPRAQVLWRALRPGGRSLPRGVGRGCARRLARGVWRRERAQRARARAWRRGGAGERVGAPRRAPLDGRPRCTWRRAPGPPPPATARPLPPPGRASRSWSARRAPLGRVAEVWRTLTPSARARPRACSARPVPLSDLADSIRTDRRPAGPSLARALADRHAPWPTRGERVASGGHERHRSPMARRSTVAADGDAPPDSRRASVVSYANSCVQLYATQRRSSAGGGGAPPMRHGPSFSTRLSLRAALTAVHVPGATASRDTAEQKVNELRVCGRGTGADTRTKIIHSSYT